MKWKLWLLASVAMFSGTLQAEYIVKKQPDGGFTIDIDGIKLNKGSTLQRQTVLLSNPASTVELVSGHLGFIHASGGFRFSGSVELKLNKPIQAIQIRHAVYDVFGQHLRNLSNVEVKDHGAGQMKVEGIWRSSENDIGEALTNVVYVARVRFNDGTQWVADFSEIAKQLESLQLEKLADPKDLDK